MRRVIIGAILALLVPAGAWAQTNGTKAFTQLPPGEQKIVNALFAAQQTGTSQKSKDEIAAMKGHEGWGRVFKEMKALGLLRQKNLGQVVSNFERQQHEARGATTGRARGEGGQSSGASASDNGRGAGHSGGKR